MCLNLQCMLHLESKNLTLNFGIGDVCEPKIEIVNVDGYDLHYFDCFCMPANLITMQLYVILEWN